MDNIVAGLRLAFQFLTTIPLKKEVSWKAPRAKAFVAFFPIVGLVLGCLLVIQAYVLINWSPLSNFAIAGWLLTFSLFYSGGLHLDGWADFHDAIFSRKKKHEKLAIMKDPHMGTFAMLAVLLLLFWRFLFIMESIDLAGSKLFLALLLIPFLMRLLIGWQVLLGSF